MAVLVLLNILKTLLTSQNIYQLAKLGLRIRTALTSSLYKKALSLNPKARQEQTGKILNNKYFVILHFINIYILNWLVGETVNLMAIDSGRLEMLAQNVNTIWSAPLQTGLSLYFLWTYLGISALAGLIVMILLIPVNAILSRQMRKYQIDNMKNKDTRIKVCIYLN